MWADKQNQVIHFHLYKLLGLLCSIWLLDSLWWAQKKLHGIKSVNNWLTLTTATGQILPFFFLNHCLTYPAIVIDVIQITGSC